MCWTLAAEQGPIWQKCSAASPSISGSRVSGRARARRSVRRAATERVFGFEIMPAPFVVAHLQVGLTMQNLGAPLAEDGSERAGVFLTNALTGWAATAPPEQLEAFSRGIPDTAAWRR